jgi:hypothetical protein
LLIPIASSVFPALSCTSFKVSGLIFRFYSTFSWYLYWVTSMDLVSVFVLNLCSFWKLSFEILIFSVDV